MSRRTGLVALLCSVAMVGTAVPAGAGGWWSSLHVNRRHVNVGDTLTVRGDIMFATTDEAQEMNTKRYSVYLVRGIDRELLDKGMSVASPPRWWARPRVAVRMGPVQLSQRDANIAVASATVRVPKVPPGRYAVMMCDGGCRRPLADLIPTEGIHVYPVGATTAADVAQAAAVARETREESRMMDESLATQIDELQQHVDRVAASAERANDALDALQDERADPRLITAPPPAGVWRSAAGWAVAALLALAWIAVSLRRRRQASAEADGAGPDVADDADDWEYAGRR